MVAFASFHVGWGRETPLIVAFAAFHHSVKVVRKPLKYGKFFPQLLILINALSRFARVKFHTLAAPVRP
jgi:hypothetical protein